MNILVTGGAGFIGSHLSEALLQLGHQVVALDNLSTGHRNNINPILGDRRFRLVDGSVLDESCLEPLVAEADLVYHLAAAVGVTFVLENLIETIENNVRGSENVIKSAHRCGGKKVVITSSSEVYGKTSVLPYREDGDLVLGPTSVGRWEYACSKMMDEFLALAYHAEQKLPVVIARLFNTVGPRQQGRYGMVIPRFVSQALENQPITVYGDGTQTRCFTYVGDTVNALIEMAQVPDAEGQVFNVGSDHEVSINELATLVKGMLNSDSSIVHIPYDEHYGAQFEDVARRVPDISKIKSYMAFEPGTELGTIIREVADHLTQQQVEARSGMTEGFGAPESPQSGIGPIP